ncbi:hypothetical protein BDV59DRAFT_101482 [Aspergillus ambiguus]|uniref:uncharacterized protein n=1 Tax=Aspergillus ambiguus TaxID=176160 RepID=UPI003CCD2F8B
MRHTSLNETVETDVSSLMSDNRNVPLNATASMHGSMAEQHIDSTTSWPRDLRMVVILAGMTCMLQGAETRFFKHGTGIPGGLYGPIADEPGSGCATKRGAQQMSGNGNNGLYRASLITLVVDAEWPVSVTLHVAQISPGVRLNDSRPKLVNAVILPRATEIASHECCCQLSQCHHDLVPMVILENAKALHDPWGSLRRSRRREIAGM